MEPEKTREQLVGQAEGSGHVTWTTSMSSYMLTNLANVVANGLRTSSGFKKVHLNTCARALNDHFQIRLTRDQIGNHVRTWKRKYAKINSLKNLSAALWDEDNCMITLDHEHYAAHIKDHKADAENLNKPLEHYREMATIFGNSMATGKYAKGSNDSLGTEVTETEGEEADATTTNDENGATATNDENGATSSSTKPKRAKTGALEEDRLQKTL